MDEAVLEHAFRSHRARVDAIFAAGDWSAYADEFTPDATYRRPGHPLVEGREGIRAWARGLNEFPASEIESLDLVWHSLDAVREAVFYEVRSTMRDPGDGSRLCASTLTSLFYGGNGLWRACVDVSNPRAHEDMYRNWLRIAVRHGLEVPDLLEVPPAVVAPRPAVTASGPQSTPASGPGSAPAAASSSATTR